MGGYLGVWKESVLFYIFSVGGSEQNMRLKSFDAVDCDYGVCYPIISSMVN